jgi:hypothetical protein
VKTQLIGIAASVLAAGALLLVLRACDVSAEVRGIWVGALGYAAGDLTRLILDRRQARKS